MAFYKMPCAFPTWIARNRFSHTEFDIQELKNKVEQDGLRITVIIPAKEVASTIAGVIVNTVQPLLNAGIVSRLVAIDAASQDGTGKVAASHGAEVIQRKDIASELGPSRGKGDALWRALLATDGDIVAFLDGDTRDPDSAHLLGILGPLILRDEIQMVRASFDRPFKSAGGDLTPNEGGRVTEILARPLLNSYWPELAGFSQPLAGEFAARRSLLEALPFPVSYGVEIATLIDTHKLVGLGAMAQVDVGCRLNSHQPLRKLAVMSQEIICTAMRRAGHATLSMARMYLPWQQDFHDIDATERQPICEYWNNIDVWHPSNSKGAWSYPGPPFVNIDGVRMFRDIGGYQTIGGSSMRSGLMFRSGELSSMTPVGLESFKKLAIGKVFDLRSPNEIVNGCHQHVRPTDSGLASPEEFEEPKSMIQAAGINVVAAPVFSDEDWLPQPRNERLKQYANAASVSTSASSYNARLTFWQGYAEAYKRTLTQGSPAFSKIFEHLASADPCPILFHCSAGKDRTGVMSMLILSLAGCDHATIAYEYALNDLDADWRASSIQRLLAQPGLNGNVDSVTNVVRARSEYMIAALEMLDREFGGAHGYLKNGLQFDEEKIAAIRANVTVS